MTAPSPPASDHPATARRGSRLGALARHPQASAALLAMLIGFSSVFSAVIAWRASLASIDSSRYESLAVVEQARREQIERQLESVVAQDLRFVNAYQEHALAARELQEQADALRETDSAAADILDLEAHSRAALARSMQPFFLGAAGITLGDDGTVPYDEEFVLRNLRDTNVELRELSSERTLALAQRADSRVIELVGAAAIIVAALFFLTIAQVSRARVRMRQWFFAGGALLVAVGTIGFLVVELFV